MDHFYPLRQSSKREALFSSRKKRLRRRLLWASGIGLAGIAAIRYSHAGITGARSLNLAPGRAASIGRGARMRQGLRTSLQLANSDARILGRATLRTAETVNTISRGVEGLNRLNQIRKAF